MKLQSECPNKYAKDLLERAVSRKILEQVYMQGLDRTMWLQVREVVRTVGRAQELFLINMTSPSLASNDSESPADDLEVDFLVELRRTFC